MRVPGVAEEECKSEWTADELDNADVADDHEVELVRGFGGADLGAGDEVHGRILRRMDEIQHYDWPVLKC